MRGATGKEIVADKSLVFKRTGDTYTLTSVTGGTSKCNHVSSLDTFTTQSGFKTNCFWPMDYRGTHPTPGDPYDDKVEHNSFFGMQYQVDFTIPEDYTGPLEYYFYGDDDLWVFLDGQLIIDVGGVHSSIGAYVDLRKELPAERLAGKHKLEIFYMERGCFGSSCYMQFTLPSAIIRPPQLPDEGALKVTKLLEGSASTEEFTFEIKLDFSNVAGKPKASYPYTRYDAQNRPVEPSGSISSENPTTFQLRAGEYIIVNGLPVGTTYTVTETDAGGFTPSITHASGTVTGNSLDAGIVPGENDVIFTNRASYQLPSTGAHRCVYSERRTAAGGGHSGIPQKAVQKKGGALTVMKQAPASHKPEKKVFIFERRN